jgi:hypothetical protein
MEFGKGLLNFGKTVNLQSQELANKNEPEEAHVYSEKDLTKMVESDTKEQDDAPKEFLPFDDDDEELGLLLKEEEKTERIPVNGYYHPQCHSLLTYNLDVDVVFVGAGPVGLWTAILLKLLNSKVNILMYEKYKGIYITLRS